MKKLVLILLPLAACSVGGNKEGTIYAIRPAALEEQGCKINLGLQVAEPSASAGLDTRRIAVYENEQRLNFYTGARWAAPVPEMLQTALVEGFEKTAAFKSVSTDMDSVRADVILLTDIRSYQIEENTVNLRFVTKLINAENRNVLKTITVEKTATPAEHKIDSIVDAFSDATNQAVTEVIGKTLAIYPSCRHGNM